MGDSTSSSSSNAADLKAHLIKEVKSHEVAIAELKCLSSSRSMVDKPKFLNFQIQLKELGKECKGCLMLEKLVHVKDGVRNMGAVYEKDANIFFRTTNQKATASEQKHLDLAKRKLEMLNIS